MNPGRPGFRILFLLLLVGGICPADGQNLIQNPGAELTPVLSNSWIRSGGSLNQFGFDPTQGGDWYLNSPSTYFGGVSQSGADFFSAGSDNTNIVPDGYDEIMQHIPLDAYTGTDGSFTFNGYGSTNGGLDSGRFIVKFYNTSSSVVHTFDTVFKAADGTDVSYHLITHSWNMAAADNIKYAEVYIGAFAGGVDPIQVFSDGFSLMNGPVLPLSLLDFTAAQKPDNTVDLAWQTAEEQNSHYIEVQRSGNGKDFAAIGQVPAAGNSKLVKDYSFTDQYPLTGSAFYRLRLVDLDASFKYSKVVEVRSSVPGKTLEVFNNPFYDQIGVKINTGASDQLTLTLMDMTGRVYLRQAYRAQAGNNFINMYPSAGIAKGVYLLHVKGGATNQTIKLLKER